MTFAKMAANRLNLQTPELSKYVVAFKDLSDELPENTGIQCGMFILDITGRYFYIPVIAKANNIQVLESIFDSETKTFIPITKKSVEWVIDQGFTMGKPEKIPAHVARDPDLYDAIVPPKTGKFVYASEGRIGGFFTTLPSHHKQAALRIIDEDYDLQQAMAKVMDLDIVKDFLKREVDLYEAVDNQGPPAPQVITSTAGLNQDQVQDILAKGYTVVNPPKSKRVVVESSSSQALTKVSALPPGRAAMVMTKDGSWIGVASLKVTPRVTLDSATKDGNRDSSSDAQTTLITEGGYVVTNPNAVMCNSEISYDDVISRLKCKKLTEVNMDEKGMIFTGSAWYGPVRISSVVGANGWTTISVGSGVDICVHPSLRSLFEVNAGKIYMSTSAMFYPMGKLVELESDINAASYKSDIEMTRVLPYQSTLVHRNGTYAVDGKEVGSKPQIIEYLLNNWEIDVPTVETFVKKASEQERVIVKMAAVRDGGRASPGSGTKVQQHYQQGMQPGSDDIQLTGNARQRAIGMANSAKAIKGVQDREIMEATIISEMLQNPDLAGSISEYLPDIKQAIDRLGRSLFLMRLNTNKLSDKIDAEALNNLFTSTRNAYRILGDNYVALQGLVANG